MTLMVKYAVMINGKYLKGTRLSYHLWTYEPDDNHKLPLTEHLLEAKLWSRAHLRFAKSAAKRFGGEIKEILY